MDLPDNLLVAATRTESADVVIALPHPLIWAPIWWLISFACWRIGLRIYGKIDPTPTFHTVTVVGARVLAMSVMAIFFTSFGWRAWYVSVPTGMMIAGVTYLFAAQGWVERAYLEDVRDELEHRLASSSSARNADTSETHDAETDPATGERS